VHQELWQEGVKRAEGKAVMVHYCYKAQASQKIPENIKTALQQHLVG
jgi:acyl-CoA thioesterase FadM